jgi:hypothetical protein
VIGSHHLLVYVHENIYWGENKTSKEADLATNMQGKIIIQRQLINPLKMWQSSSTWI